MLKHTDNTPPGPPYPIIDGHCDLLYEMSRSHRGIAFDKLDDLPVTLEKMQVSNVLIIVAALYCPDSYNGSSTSSLFLGNLMDYAEEYLTSLVHIRSGKQMEECFSQKKPGMIWLVENADGLLDLDRRKLERSGIRVAGLTHMGRNRIGDGNTVPYPEGLSSAGKDLVKELSQKGFAFDAAHLAQPGFRDLARIHEGPLLSSHTGVRALCDDPRNLTKEQIGIILERKGVVGIAADPRMLSKNGEATIEDVFRHIDWIAQSFEADGIAIGTDFCGFHTVNTGLEDVSKLPDLADMLLKRGYPEDSVRKIMGGNWYRFYQPLLNRSWENA
jgi:membrane dipeptidase